MGRSGVARGKNHQKSRKMAKNGQKWAKNHRFFTDFGKFRIFRNLARLWVGGQWAWPWERTFSLFLGQKGVIFGGVRHSYAGSKGVFEKIAKKLDKKFIKIS